MADRYSRGSSNSRSEHHGSPCNSNYRSRGKNPFYCASYRSNRENKSRSRYYGSMNRFSGSNLSFHSDSSMNQESRNHHSRNNDQYSNSNDDDYRRHKEDRRDHKGSDMTGYSNFSKNVGHYSVGGSRNYVRDHQRRSSNVYGDNFKASSSEKSHDYSSDSCKLLLPDDHHLSLPSPKHSNPSNSHKSTREFRMADRWGSRDGSSKLIKSKELEFTSNWQTIHSCLGYNRRKYTRSSYKRNHIHYRARKIGEFGEKTHQFREDVMPEDDGEKKVKKSQLDGDASKPGSGDQSSLSKKKNVLLDSSGESFIKFVCQDCEFQSQSLRMYERHLLKKHHLALIAKSPVVRYDNYEEPKEQKEIVDKPLTHKVVKLSSRPLINNRQPRSSSLGKRLLCRTACIKRSNIYERHIKRKTIVPSANEANDGVNMDNLMVSNSVGFGNDNGSEKNKKETIFNNTICLGKEFCKKVVVEIYYCELCNFNLPPCDNFELQLNQHCSNDVHIQRFLEYCNQNEVKVKTEDEKIKTKYNEEIESDSDFSNKCVKVEIKNDASDKGGDSRVNGIKLETVESDIDIWKILDKLVKKE